MQVSQLIYALEYEYDCHECISIQLLIKPWFTVVYKTVVRPQLEYAPTVWYPHHDKDIKYKDEAVQRRAAMWATRYFRYTSSVTAMLKDLNWRTLDQHRIDSRLLMMYKVTYNLVAIPATEYLVRNTRQSRHIHSLAYRQILTLNYYYRFTFSPGLSST